jgi:hypothetical protein
MTIEFEILEDKIEQMYETRNGVAAEWLEATGDRKLVLFKQLCLIDDEIIRLSREAGLTGEPEDSGCEDYLGIEDR